MPDEKKKVFVNLSQHEYDDLQSLAVFHSANDDIWVSWRVSRMIHDFCIERIKRNRRLISRHRLFLHQLDNEHSYRYTKIKQAFNRIRNIHDNALKTALHDEEDLIPCQQNLNLILNPFWSFLRQKRKTHHTKKSSLAIAGLESMKPLNVS